MSVLKNISSWTDLAAAVESSAQGSWIFRGEGVVRNPLLPKAGRVGSYRGAARKKPYRLADEKRALESFKKQARPHLGHSPSSDIEWLAIAQHHGMSTRLLDWTESLLVAGYFAVAEAGSKGDAVVYGIRGLPGVSKATEKNPFSIRAVSVYHPPHISPRIPAQRSVFTVHPDPTVPFTPAKLVEWRIQRNTCMVIKKVLDACAINESSLFPDLDGLSRYLGWRYKWAKQ